MPRPHFFMKAIKQSEAVNYIQRLLIERGINASSRKQDHWDIFEYQSKQIGVDQKAGVWIRELEGDWRCVATPCTVSGAAQAVEFLITEEARQV